MFDLNKANQNTELFIGIYRSFLRSGGGLEIEQIIQPYTKSLPFLHQKVDQDIFDIPAFIYTSLRLPEKIFEVKQIYLAQTESIFLRENIQISSWQEVFAPARRRKMYFDGKNQLCSYVNSVTDVDDLVCLLTAYQIEWNKIHQIIKSNGIKKFKTILNNKSEKALQIFCKIDPEDWQRLKNIYNSETWDLFKALGSHKVSFQIQHFRGSYIDYKKASSQWFQNIIDKTIYKNFISKPIYFVSSNNHSIVNNITGFANSKEKILIQFLQDTKQTKLLQYYKHLRSPNSLGSKENFLWYILKKYEKIYPEVKEERIAIEQGLGIDYIEAKTILDVNVQLIKIKRFVNSDLPQKFNQDLKNLIKSDSIIFNIDYPLGLGAYMILSTLFKNSANIKGVYILGKASLFNGKLGDIVLPSKVFDSHTNNTFIFKNAFDKSYFKEFKNGNVIENANGVTERGTLLHHEDLIKDYFQKGYSVFEMENGPYLNSIYEMFNYSRYPENETVNMVNSPVDIGIIHYASDTPFTKAVTLGTRNLGYDGVEPTYCASLAILKRITEQELRNL